MRVAGIALIILSSMLIGRALALTLDASVLSARAIAELVGYAKDMVESFSMSGEEILRTCKPELLLSCGYKCEHAPKSFAELSSACEIDDGESARIFGEFCRDFGKSYREEQERRCKRYYSLLDSRATELCGEVRAKKKIVYASAFSCGAMLAILLI